MSKLASSLDPATSKEITQQLLAEQGSLENVARILGTDTKFVQDVLDEKRCLSTKHIKSFEREFNRSMFEWFASGKLPSVPPEHRQMTEEAIELFKSGFALKKELERAISEDQ